MEIKSYNSLPKAALDIRIKVFVEEQGFVDEVDAIDKTATHFVMFDGERAVATCRIYKNEKGYILGRLAVLNEYRKKGIGQKMMHAAEQKVKEYGGNCLQLHAQIRAEGFYKKCGYEPFGEIELEENYPHIWYKKYF